MIDKKTVVDLPKSPHKIKLVHAKRGHTYVQLETGRVYDKAKKYNLPVRVSIGKLCDFDKSKMYPNLKYYELLGPESAKTQEESHELPSSDLYLLESQSENKRNRLLKVGSHLVLKQIADDSNLMSLLIKSINEAGLEGIVSPESILDLASYSIVKQSNVSQRFDAYAHDHYLFSPEQRILSSSSISRLLPNITADLQLTFLDEWNKQFADCKEVLISYDSTNKNCQAGDIEIVEFGNAKVDMGTPIYNIAIATSVRGCIPLLFEVYGSSIPDVSQLDSFIAKLRTYGYKNVTLTIDRGYFSAKNFELIDKVGFNFIMMVKGCKEMLSDFIAEHGNSIITDPTYSIKAGRKLCGRTIEQDFLGKKRYFHLCFSLEKCIRETSALEDELNRQTRILKSHENKQVEITDTAILENFAITYSDDGKTFLYATQKTDVVNSKYTKCGFFCIITSMKMTATEAYRDYKSRDTSEKLFATDKTFLGAKSARGHSHNSLMGSIFILFIALILRSKLYVLLKDEQIRIGKRQQYLNVPKAIDELEKIQIIQPVVGKPYVQSSAIHAKARQILSCFGISKEEAMEKIAAICTNEVLYKGSTSSKCNLLRSHEDEGNANDLSFYNESDEDEYVDEDLWY